MTRRVIVIGAGPGGLAAAMLLAKAGLDVRVIERQPHVGGRTSTLVRDGFRFDLGPTFFLYPRVLREIFAATGHDLDREAPMTRLDPQYHLVFGGGGGLRCTHDVAAMQAQIAELDAADAANFPRFLDDNREKLARFRCCLERPFLGVKDLLSPELIRLLPLLRPWLSLDGELGRYFRDPRLRLAFSFQSKYLGMSPFNCPSLFSILSFLEYEHGVWHPEGGCGAVSRAMARVAEGLGATISLDEDVTAIRFVGRRAVGVQTTKGDYDCDALVINADFARAMTRLAPDAIRRRWTDRKIEASASPARRSCSISASKGVRSSWPTTPSTLHRTTRRTSTRSNSDTSSRRTTRRSTCRTPASPTSRSPRRATAPSMSCCRSPTSTRTSIGGARRGVTAGSPSTS